MYSTRQSEHLVTRRLKLRLRADDELFRASIAGRSPRRSELGRQATESPLRPISETTLQTAALRVSRFQDPPARSGDFGQTVPRLGLKAHVGGGELGRRGDRLDEPGIARDRAVVNENGHRLTITFDQRA